MVAIILSLTTFFIGALLHYTHSLPHDTSKKNILDIISAINESTWEHMKILIVGGFFAVFIIGPVYDVFSGVLLISSAISIAFSAALLPLFYYAYKHFMKKNILAMDIGIFTLVSLIFGILTSVIYQLFVENGFNVSLFIGIVPWVMIWGIIIWWTYYPPNNILFKCPVSNDLGHEKS